VPDNDSGVSQPVWLKNLLGGTDSVTRAVQAALGVGGLGTSILTAWNNNPYIFLASIAVTIVAALWIAAGAYLRRRKPKSPGLPAEPRSSSSYLRGLLPFERGELLLGRDQEAGRLLAMLRSLEYRFGFLSGEAGAGKTSLLRARILPDLEQGGKYQTVYLPRTGSDPEGAVRKKVLSIVASPERFREATTLVDLMRQTSAAFPDKTLILIFDQFEEYFVINRTREARDSFEKALSNLSEADLPVRVLFSLRKEFVDDLLDFARMVPPLQNLQWRLPLRNFGPEIAREITRNIVQAEHLRFSDELQDLVVADLSRNQQVRPVEFQLVLTTLLIQSVFDVAAYRTVGGAQGVIARFVSETIAPPDIRVDEIERWVARLALRALCNKEFTTRRPVGLTRSELVEQIWAGLQSKGQFPATRTEVEQALDRVLRRFLDGYIVIFEDEERYNLAHDYLTSPIRDATGDVETVEERAVRLLEQYVEQAKIVHGVVLPWRTLRFIERFADSEALNRTAAVVLLKRSRFRYNWTRASIAVGALALAGVLLPYGVRYSVEERLDLSGARFLSQDGKVLVAIDRESNSASVVRLDGRKLLPAKLQLPSSNIVLSPRGTIILVLDADGGLYQANTREGSQVEKIIERTGWPDKFFPRTPWAGFSSDESWAFFSTADGRVFAWPTNSKPREVTRLQTLTDSFGSSIDLNSATDKMPPQRIEPPPLGISSNGKWLWVIDGSGRFLIVATDNGANIAPKEVATLARGRSIFRPIDVSISSSGKWLAVSDGSDEIRVLRIKDDIASTPIVVLKTASGDRARTDPADIWFSPDEKWLVARRVFDNFFTSELGETIKIQTLPAVELPRTSSDGRATVVFDASGEYVAGRAQDQQIYVWQLNKPPRATAKALISSGGFSPEDRGQNVVFCPQGDRLLVSTEDGGLYAVQYKNPTQQRSQIGRLTSGDTHFLVADDQRTVFVYDSGRLVTGLCGEYLSTVIEHNSQIMNFVGDGMGSIVLIARTDVTRIGRAFYLFGLPIWGLPWPAFGAGRIEN
jgi:WD40 repeat protein